MPRPVNYPPTRVPVCKERRLDAEIINIAKLSKELSTEQREENFQSLLLHNKAITVGTRDAANQRSNLAVIGDILQQHFAMDDGRFRSQLLAASEIYYGQNAFLVQLPLLHQFLYTHPWRFEFHIPVPSLVDIISVDLDLHDGYMDPCVYGGDIGENFEASRARLANRADTKLRDLLAFAETTTVSVQLRGLGKLDGSDVATQQTIHDIAGVVRDFRDKFGEQFDIRKVVDDNSQSLLDYWSPPTMQSQTNGEQNMASFAGIMQRRIEQWIFEKDALRG